MLEPSGLYYPNRFARYFLTGMQMVLGEEGLRAIRDIAGLTMYLNQWPADTLERQFDFAYLAGLSAALEELYGPRGGRGVALKIGRAWFEAGFSQFGVFSGFHDPAFVALPLHTRSHLALRALTNIFQQYSDQYMQLLTDEDSYRISIEISPMAWGRQTDRPVCHAQIGLMQGCLNMASGGYEYHVRELTCRATGHDECTFAVNRKPIGQL